MFGNGFLFLRTQLSALYFFSEGKESIFGGKTTTCCNIDQGLGWGVVILGRDQPNIPVRMCGELAQVLRREEPLLGTLFQQAYRIEPFPIMIAGIFNERAQRIDFF